MYIYIYNILFQILFPQLAIIPSDTTLPGSQAQDLLSMPHCYKHHSLQQEPRQLPTNTHTHTHVPLRMRITTLTEKFAV